jgi:DNA-directed RNA polymerase beta' subunit
VAASRALVDALLADPALRGLVISDLAMVPPELRPLHRDDDDRWMATGVNVWYQRILTRNATLARQLAAPETPAATIDATFANLHDLIRRLFENDELPDPDRDARGTEVHSLVTVCGDSMGLAQILDKPADGTARLPVARLILFGLGFDPR